MHTGIDKFARDPTIDIDSGNHERSEEIALPAFIYAEVRLEHFRRVHFFITQLRFAKDFRLKLKLHELFDTLALDKHLWPFFVNRHTETVFPRKKKRVLFRTELESRFREQRAKRRRLVSRQSVRVGVHCARA